MPAPSVATPAIAATSPPTEPAVHVIVAARERHDREWIAKLLQTGASRPIVPHPVISGTLALTRARSLRAKPLVLIAAALDDLSPLSLLGRLAGRAGQMPCPVIVITPGTGRDQGPALLRAGAQDYIGESWLSPFGLARAMDNAQVRWAAEQELRARDAALQVEVADRRRIEGELRQAQRLMQTIIDGAGALVFAKDLQGRYFLTNRAWRESVGLSERQAEGATDEEVLGTEFSQAVRCNDHTVLATGSRLVVEETASIGGDRRTWLCSKFPLRDEAGQTYAVCGVSTDVTSLKQVQSALLARERELQTLADNTPDALLRFDRGGRIVFANAAAGRLAGAHPNGVIGRNLRELDAQPSMRRACGHALRAVLRSGARRVATFELQAPAGMRIFSCRFVPEFGDNGLVEHVLAVLHDDTERQNTEQDLRRRTHLMARLAEASRRVHASLSAEQIAQVLTDEARQIVGAHRAVTVLAPSAANAQPVRAVDLSSDCQADRRVDAHAWAASFPPPAQAQGQGQGATQAFDARSSRMSSQRLRVTLTGHAGEALGVVHLQDAVDGGRFNTEDEAVLMQLAAMASIGLENAKLYASIRESDLRKDRFLATLAHELRNPLAPIRSGLEILRVKAGLQGSTARTRDVMERQLTHLVRLVDDLLDVSRISRGKIELRCERLPLQQVLDSAMETSRPLIERGGHALQLAMPSRPIWVVGDHTRLAQVVSNLLNNAAKYTPPGGRIELSLASERESARIEVADNGSGIAPAMLPRVFDLFIQADDALPHAQGGLGIGLSLVRQLVELHGGSVRADSAGPGAGSRFTLWLPRTRRASHGA